MIFFNAFACGRPIITRLSDYKGKLAEELLVDKETALLLDNRSYLDIYSYISTMTPLQYEYMTQQTYNRFLEKVNYSEEEKKIRKFIENSR